MDPHLQSIYDLLQKATSLPDEEKESILRVLKDADKAQGFTKFKLDRLDRDRQTLSVMLEESIGDLQKKSKAIEEQNRELEIESALERVRSVAMGMMKPADMLDICKTISQQLELLKVKEVRNVQTAIFYVERGTYTNYEYYAKHDKLLVTEVKYKDHPLSEEFANRMLGGQNQVWIHGFKGKEVKDWLEYQKSTNVFIDTYLETADSLNYYWYSLGPVALGASTYAALNEDEIELFKRLRNVFELAYRRYLDIEKAEAQAKEARIEAALERVRARTMGMHQSNDLHAVINVINDQLLQLGFQFDGANFATDFTETGYNMWLASPGETFPEQIHVPRLEYKGYHQLDEAIRQGKDFFTYTLNQEEKNNFFKHFFENTVAKTTPEESKQFVYSTEGMAASVAILKKIIFSILNFQAIPYTEEENNIIKRFAAVFEQSYTRFLDLQKAEAQAREAKIEAALERTRTQSMIMQHSNELDDTLRVFHEQVLLLGIRSAFSFLWLPDEEKDRHIFWAAWGENNNGPTVFKSKAINYPMDRNEPATAQCLVDWKSDEPVISYQVPPAGVENYFAAWKELIDGVEQLKPAHFSGGLYYVEAFMKYGCFGVMVTNDLTEDEKKVLGRFAIEFERAYTRFLDLQKSEAQSREAQIELGLERVRARAMAMQKSGELSELVDTVFKELTKLDFALTWCIINIIDESSMSNTVWAASPDINNAPESYYMKFEDYPFHHAMMKGWKDKKSKLVYVLGGAEKKDYDEYLFNKTDFRRVPEAAQSASRAMERYVVTFSFSNFGGLQTVGDIHLSEANLDILSRFGKVFDLTYTRFNDLKQAEAQTREALIEGALERVRARALAMQQPEELKEVAQVLRNEMGALGVEELETSSIYIHGDNSTNVECWYALQDPKHLEKKMVADHFVLNLEETWVGKEMKNFYLSNEKQTSVVMQGANRREWIEYCYSHSPVFTGFYGETIPDRTYHLYKFSHGYIGAAAPGDISGESWKLLGRAASVFSLAYSRFKDLSQARSDLIQLREEKKRAEDALTELQSTQRQLIQSEKMASLGELTAGIAHEIQNPLNFVNNFSEVSNELIEEMKEELAKGNNEDAIAIAEDVKLNLEKINHHGKRADAIVKGMLQHSRTSSGQKEATEINALADEYLRLAYHGLRAKDKSFNAKLETDFDSSIGKINVVPQEIGRVILNLINNAFYAAPLSASGGLKNPQIKHEPTVWVSTKKNGNNVLISVRDNGPGIPIHVLEKIFQPFFTTKPTGQGTGLGLSLSYDIITKGHGGEIKVETKEGEGTSFIVSLPISN